MGGVDMSGPGTAADEARMRKLAMGLSMARAGFGVAAMLAPGISARIMGFPRDQDNATARLIGRLFAVREIALAGLTCALVQRSVVQPDLYMANATVDIGDLTVCGLTFIGRRGIPRASLGSAVTATPFVAGWLWLRGSCQG
jgi:hypothetical protein